MASSSSLISSTSTSLETSTDEELKQRKSKRRKLTHAVADVDGTGKGKIRWRTDAEQQIYSSKLLDALRIARRTPSSSAAVKGREIREVADRALAVAARGTTRWSRAILASRRRLRIKKVKKARVTGEKPLRRKDEKKRRSSSPGALEKRARVLSRLVPGCRKVSFPSLLEEATDYIAALEMQVKAMAALAEILSSGAGNNRGTTSAAV